MSQPSTAPVKSKERITDKKVISLIKKALEEGSNLEVQVNNRSEVLFTRFLDHPPQAVDGEVAEKSKYQPFSYLSAKDHLVIARVVPEESNENMVPGSLLRLRFYNGKKAIESYVVLIEPIEIGGQHAYKLGFPTTMEAWDQRRHFRVKVIPELEIGIVEPMKARIMDLSVGGMAICFPSDMEPIPAGTPMNFKIKVPPSLEVQHQHEIKTKSGLVMELPSNPDFELMGYVRNYGSANDQQICPKGQRCGVQFQISSALKAMQVGELYGFVEREFLRKQALSKGDQGNFHAKSPHEGHSLLDKIKSALLG
ncbi:type IV pilus assembly PilZ [Magnetococcus marinus MC-1]|uniref:Type IV pilus assembly PilZ n=1 Tax=Magnetococcus marinus (strain ATCC BAA-1437 / JCM 17883 / MC-1) TaxID=156889 RepID=A0L3Z0_MAGMM|nr:PilZ domain-containing protein [Magnetococcus marinus]ABK42683.1 type IV pilus assembly PilZ [Magnetococcus marinus MC-1]